MRDFDFEAVAGYGGGTLGGAGGGPGPTGTGPFGRGFDIFWLWLLRGESRAVVGFWLWN